MITLEAFEAGAIDPEAFTHRAHVEVAAAMLREADFLDAACRYQAGIVRIAESVGAPTKPNLTITLAFLSLIAERMRDGALDASLLNSRVLGEWYSRERLAHPLARTVFLMPDRAPMR